ncbi:RAMP superfamily CRISPR-associated protein, partial [Methanopyrus sp.]
MVLQASSHYPYYCRLIASREVLDRGDRGPRQGPGGTWRLEQALALTVTPTRVGSGARPGVIDLPLTRRRHTRIPYVPGSSLKGPSARTSSRGSTLRTTRRTTSSRSWARTPRSGRSGPSERSSA